jgi:hypothetical protein
VGMRLVHSGILLVRNRCLQRIHRMEGAD